MCKQLKSGLAAAACIVLSTLMRLHTNQLNWLPSRCVGSTNAHSKPVYCGLMYLPLTVQPQRIRLIHHRVYVWEIKAVVIMVAKKDTSGYVIPIVRSPPPIMRWIPRIVTCDIDNDL